jgi:hypothetical protein
VSEWMNVWMNEWMNEWMNVQTNERMNSLHRLVLIAGTVFSVKQKPNFYMFWTWTRLNSGVIVANFII